MEVEKRLRPNILVTGTPGCGKTTLSRLLAEALDGYTYANVGELINTHRLYESWNDKFNVSEFDEDKVVDYFEQHFAKQLQEGGLLVDFHSSGFFPVRYFDLVILLRCGNEKLYDRLKQRGYSAQKITENIECEIMEVTKDEVTESYDESIILQLKSEEQGDVQQNIDRVIEWIQRYVKGS